MLHPVIGWECETPVPDGYAFNDYLNVRQGRLYFEDLDLTQLLVGGGTDQGLGGVLSSPLEIVYLPKIRQNIARLCQAFDFAIREVKYAGRFLYAYASKANAAEEVVRTVLGAGVHYEISSSVDVEIVRLMKTYGYLPPERWVICNGFKHPGTQYAHNILKLREIHANVIPVIEDLPELESFLGSDRTFDIGLRQKSYGSATHIETMGAINSRFGMHADDLSRAAEMITATPHLRFKLYHAMVGSQITSEEDFVNRLLPSMEIFAQLRKHHPDLQIFNYGGGIPAAMTLNFSFDYQSFAVRLLNAFQDVCARHQVPVPDVMGEMGRFTVAEHGAHLFKVLNVKENASTYPWYIMDGSVMSSLPDAWALAEHFILLPLNHLDRPFRRVQLGGITCDSDDVYPPKSSQSPLYLPVDVDGLYIGFFAIGAYQEMLGGAGGSKHCVIPEAEELIVDRDQAGNYHFQRLPGQTTEKVLNNLGYSLSSE